MVTASEKSGTDLYFCIKCGQCIYLEISTNRLQS
jgi:hypothetical protein